MAGFGGVHESAADGDGRSQMYRSILGQASLHSRVAPRQRREWMAGGSRAGECGACRAVALGPGCEMRSGWPQVAVEGRTGGGLCRDGCGCGCRPGVLAKGGCTNGSGTGHRPQGRVPARGGTARGRVGDRPC
eukprot:9747168-Karenia_brevis.AAC.1